MTIHVGWSKTTQGCPLLVKFHSCMKGQFHVRLKKTQSCMIWNKILYYDTLNRTKRFPLPLAGQANDIPMTSSSNVSKASLASTAVFSAGFARTSRSHGQAAVRATLWGLRGNIHGSSMARWKPRCRLAISANWTLFGQLSRLRRYKRILVEIVVFEKILGGRRGSPTNDC